MTHDYLLVCILVSNPAFGGVRRVWARCERNPGSIAGGAAKLSRDAAPALDTIKFSVHKQKLRGQGDTAIMMCDYDTLRFEHVESLLEIVHKVSPQ